MTWMDKMAGKWSTMAKSVDSGGKYVKLGDGDSMRFVVCVDADVGQEITWWLDKSPTERVIATPDTPGAKQSIKIAMAVYDVALKSIRFLRLTPPTFAKLTEKMDEFGESKIYRIKRGKGKNGFVEYTIDHIGPMTADDEARMAAAEPIDVLGEKDVIPLPEAVQSEPEPAPAPAPKRAAPRQAAEPAPDGDIPF